MFKKSFVVILFFTLIFSFFQVGTASAAPSLELQAEAGIGNKIKYLTAVPLKLTITNSGSDFSGDLVIDVAESYSTGSAIVYPLDIAKGETKEIEVYLDGMAEENLYSNTGQQKKFFYFYEGGIEDGKLIKHKGASNVKPQFQDNYSTFIYTLTENSDRLSAFQRLRQLATYNVEVFHLNQRKIDLPTDARGLELANIIVVDEESLSDLSNEQQKAIYSWVEQGGTLLIGASDQVEASAGVFKEYLPLSLSSEKVGVSKENLSSLSNKGVFSKDIEVYKAEQNEGSNRLLANGDTILAAQNKIGSGSIIQTTFSLGDEPLSTMDGYTKLLDKILNLTNHQIQNNTMGMNYTSGNDFLSYEISSINELFPSFEISPAGLVIVIIIYILFIGPVLYLVLKRLDKREHAWWVIPVISLVVTLAMFIFGAKDRLFQSQVQQSAFYKVENNHLSGHYIESILTNRGGDFTFNLDKNTTAVASSGNAYYYSDASQSILHETSYRKEHSNGSTLKLKNVNYWSVKSVIGKSKVENAGSMDIQLTLKNQLLEGSITNNFPFKLNEVAIWTGTNEIEIGDIEANSTIKVSKDIPYLSLLAPNITNYGYTYGYPTPKGKEDLLPMRLEQLKYGAGGIVGDGKPAMIGWTDQALVGIELEGNAEVSPISYIAQSFEPKIEISGDFTLDHSSLMKTVESISSMGYMELVNQQTNEWYLDKGEYDYIVSIPEGLGVESSWVELKVNNQNTNRLTLLILNLKTSKYELIEDKIVTFKENLEQYISEDGQVKIKIEADEIDFNSTPNVKLPDVEIKGVAK